MKDEIKEILEWLSDKDYYIEDFGYKFKRLSTEENEALLDYITNLQEERNNMACLVNDLQEKIDEAIEYIKEKSEEVELNFYGFPDKITSFKGSVSVLLNLLQGSDE